MTTNVQLHFQLSIFHHLQTSSSQFSKIFQIPFSVTNQHPKNFSLCLQNPNVKFLSDFIYQFSPMSQKTRKSRNEKSESAEKNAPSDENLSPKNLDPVSIAGTRTKTLSRILPFPEKGPRGRGEGLFGEEKRRSGFYRNRCSRFSGNRGLSRSTWRATWKSLVASSGRCAIRGSAVSLGRGDFSAVKLALRKWW